jgi:hypothetical protein
MVNRVKQFEMQGYYHTNAQMYRDTTDRRNIQKKVGAMEEKYGRGDQPFTMYKKNQNRNRGRTTAEQETCNEVHKKQS